MKKFFTLFAVLCAAISLKAVEAELKIGVNDASTYYAPVYSTWADKYYTSQILYKASELTELQDATITQLAFFLRAENTNGDFEKVQIRLKEVDFDEFSSKDYIDIADAVLVFEGALPAQSQTRLDVVFNAPYEYKGGTILVDVRKTEEGGAYAPTSGQKGRFQASYNMNNSVIYNYGKDGLPDPSFNAVGSTRPDISFTYEKEESHEAITNTELPAERRKYIQNGILVIEHNGQVINAQGNIIQ